MSFRSLCNHHVLVERAVETVNAFAGRDVEWVALSEPAGLNARPSQAWGGNLHDPGAGEVQTALRTWYLVPEFVVAERDLLRVESGPEAPARLRVVSVTPCTDPANVHHIEVNVEPYNEDAEEGSS